MSFRVSLSELLSAGRFTIVTDKKVHRRQEVLKIEDGILITKAFVRVRLGDVRMFYFSQPPKVRKGGRFGQFTTVPVQYRGRKKNISGRVISENRSWILLDVSSTFFLFPKEGSSRHT